jgi:CRP-like cAMP-binding protein
MSNGMAPAASPNPHHSPAMTNEEILARLRSCTLFADFTMEELSEFLDLLDPMEAKSGTCIVRQDEMGEVMFLLVAGKAKVVHHREGRDVVLAALGPGDFFGEIALVDHGPRSADVETTEDAVLLSISQASMSALAGVYPMAAFKFLITLGRIMVQRLRASNQRYIDSMLLQET